MLVSYQVQVVDEKKTAKFQRQRLPKVIKRYTEPSHFLIPGDCLSSDKLNGVVTRKNLLDHLPLEGDFQLRVKMKDPQSPDDLFLWVDLLTDEQVVEGINNIIYVRCLPNAKLKHNVQSNKQHNTISTDFLAVSVKDEITEKVEDALMQVKKDGKKALQKIGKGLKAFGALFKMKPTAFTID